MHASRGLSGPHSILNVMGTGIVSLFPTVEFSVPGEQAGHSKDSINVCDLNILFKLAQPLH